MIYENESIQRNTGTMDHSVLREPKLIPNNALQLQQRKCSNMPRLSFKFGWWMDMDLTTTHKGKLKKNNWSDENHVMKMDLLARRIWVTGRKCYPVRYCKSSYMQLFTTRSSNFPSPQVFPVTDKENGGTKNWNCKI